MNASNAALLDQIDILKPLSPEERAAVARQCRWRRFHVGEQILDQESDARDVCFVAEGRVRVVNHAASGREISFDELGAGSLMGEMAAIDGGPRSASVVALANTTLIAFLAAKPFLDLVTSHPPLALAVMRRMVYVARLATDRVVDLSTLGANNRVHGELLRLARSGRGADNTARVEPIPLHSDIAARVSTTRETVARVFGELTRDGLLEKRHDALVIRDFDALVRLVESVRGGA